MNRPYQLSVSNDEFDKAVKAMAFVRKHRIRPIEERLHDLTSLKLMPKKWGSISNSRTQINDQEKLKPIPVKIVSFDVLELMRSMNCDNEFQFWGRVLSLLHKNVFEHPGDLFIADDGEISEEHLKQIEKKIIRKPVNNEEYACDDLLGVFFHCRIKHFTPILQPWIELYPQVIAYFSFILGVSAESLATVVMTHELAHAYTLAGYDINMFRGNLLCAHVPEDMAEGIAQYYTNAVCNQLEKQYSGIEKAFSELLLGQRSPYKVFQDWKRNGAFDHESVRSSWIKYREIPANYCYEQDFRNEVQQYNQKVTKKGLWP